MAQSVLFTVLFIVVGAVLFALLAPVLFSGADMGKVGQVALPIIVVVFGAAGFAFGRARRKRS